MLQTIFSGAGASGQFGAFGTIQSTAGTAALQNYLKSIGKLSQSSVTGVMNDATMAVIFNLLIESAATVGKIPLLPADVRNGITTVTNALKSADSKIKSVSFGQASLSSVIRNWLTINALVRAIPNVGPGAADAMAAAREAVYNAVAGQASIIEKAVRIFFPPAQPTTGTVTTATAIPIQQLVTMIPGIKIAPGASPGTPGATAPGAAAAVPSGTIFARSVKFPGRIRVAIPRSAGGLGGIGLMSDGVFGDCIFGDCGNLGATAPFVETAPVTAPPAGGREVTEKDLEKQTGQTPFFKKPLFWAAVAGGAVVIGGGSYFLIRRRKRSA